MKMPGPGNSRESWREHGEGNHIYLKTKGKGDSQSLKGASREHLDH